MGGGGKGVKRIYYKGNNPAQLSIHYVFKSGSPPRKRIKSEVLLSEWPRILNNPVSVNAPVET